MCAFMYLYISNIIYEIKKEKHQSILPECLSQTSEHRISNKSDYTTTTRYKTLTQIYGRYFMLPEATIAEANQDERLWNAVRDILERRPHPPAKSQSTVITFYSQIRNIFPFSTRAASLFPTNSKKMAAVSETSGHSKSLNSGDDIKIKVAKLKDKFIELTGNSPSDYLQNQRASFESKGGLNLWEYFLQESRNQNFSDLRRNMELETDVDGYFVFTVANKRPVRVSNDGKYLLYDGLISGPLFEVVSRQCNVSVTTQFSIDRLHTYVESYVYWNGPVSVAVLLNGPMEYFVLRCKY